MAELAFAKERSFKRKLMVAQLGGGGGGGGGGDGGGGGGGGGGGELRRIHIVYYLSRNGSIDHPHLIRIHQVSHNGVYLRDVKSWLSELRGEDMPERFAWSYKRMYKGGYVWQDLLDEDLLTPICDNEYVLKGSEISSTALDMNPYNEKEVFDLKKSSSFKVNAKSPEYPSTKKEYPLVFSPDTSFEIEESSFASNATTKDTTKNQDTFESQEVIQSPKDKNENNSPSNMLCDNNTDDNNNSDDNDKSKKDVNKRVNNCFKAPSLPTNSFGKSRRFSGIHMLRNWITCGAANNTDEKAVVVVTQRKGACRVSENNMGQICKEQKLRGYEESFDHGKNYGSKKSKKEESNKFKTSGAAYKPINGPNCSQCGRQFNPEKLHSHMKYCRGMKALAKSTSTRPRTKKSTPNSASLDTLYLTNN